MIFNQPAGLLFKRLLLLFWAMYFTMVALTNFVDILDEFGVLHWVFLNSGNFDYLVSVVKVYEVGPDLTKAMLVGAWLIEVTGGILFWRALLSYGRSPGGRLKGLTALCWGVFVWTSFVFMTEFFVAYTAEAPFRELLMIMIACGIAVALVPDDAGAEPAST
jgi:hypothetical protein